MTTDQIKESIFNECEKRSTQEVAGEIGTNENALKGFLMRGQSLSTSILQKAAELYLNVESLASRPNEVLMGKPETAPQPEGGVMVIDDPFKGGPGNADPILDGSKRGKKLKEAHLAGASKPREVLMGNDSVSNAPPLAPPVKTGALATEADSKPAENGAQGVVSGAESTTAPKTTPARNICLLFPIYKSVDPATFLTVLAFWDKTQMRAEMSPGDAMIARSRNRLAKRFLATDAEWSLWLDDDLVFPCGSAGLYRFLAGAVDSFTKQPVPTHWANRIPDNFLNYSTPSRLISHGKSIVAGSYYDRWGKDTITAVYSTGPQNRFPSDSLHPVDFAGTGCMLVHRKVYEDIAKKFPGVWPENGECQFFTPIEGKERMWGEDQSFCWRAKEAGHPTYLDMGLLCGHMGMKCYGLPEK